jgi:flagellin-like protein
MNFEKVQRKNRKAISPVLATVILIAITLIAAIAIAGFVFGLFGSFTSSATVSVVSTNIPHAMTAFPANWVTAQNTGTSNTNVNSMTLTYGGVTCSPAIAVATITAGTTQAISVTGIGSCVAPAAGVAFVGNLALSNGGQVPFSGAFS